MKKHRMRVCATLGVWALTAVALTSAPSAHAESQVDHPLYIGGLLGISSVNNSVGTGIGFGLQGGYFLNEMWGLGAFLRYANHNNGYSTFVTALEGLYRLDWLIPGMHVGVILGSASLNYNNPTTGLSGAGTALTYGAKAALDVPVSAQYPVTIGADVSVMFFTPGSGPNAPMLTIFSPMGTAKWHF